MYTVQVTPKHCTPCTMYTAPGVPKTGDRGKEKEYILEGNLLEKKCKTAILLFCSHTAECKKIMKLEFVKCFDFLSVFSY